MHSFFTNILEPISYSIFALAFSLHLKTDNSIKIRVLLTFYLLATLLMFIAGMHVFSATKNIIEYNWLFIFTITSLGFYFKNLLYSPQKKRVVYSLCLLCILYFIYHQCQSNAPEIFDSIGFSLLSLAVIAMSFMYFHQLLTNVTETSIFLNADFWFTASILVYYLGCFIIFLTYYYFTEKILKTSYTIADRMLLTNLWGAHNILLFLSSFIFSFNVVWIRLRRKSFS